MGGGVMFLTLVLWCKNLQRGEGYLVLDVSFFCLETEKRQVRTQDRKLDRQSDRTES